MTKFLLSFLLSLVAAMNVGADPFLACVGTTLRNGHGRGEAVALRGVNLGGWLVREAWQTPLDSSGLQDDWSAREVLAGRFGTEESERLLEVYEDTWIKEGDFDRLAALGFNVVRLPFWYRNLEGEDGTWRADAFRRLDWCVAQAWKRGIYTVLDLHGAPGGQSDGQSTGRARKKSEIGVEPDFWTKEAESRRTEEIWRRVAGHFKGNPAVAAYDLLNEPFGAPDRDTLWTVEDRLYQAVRGVDPAHVISVEGCWGGKVDGRAVGWGWEALPPPERFRWSNVLYQTHSYEWDWNNLEKQKAMIDRQVADWETHRSWGVPCYVGEFNCMAQEKAWQYAVAQFTAHGMNYSSWGYKATKGSGTDSWGIYNYREPGLPKPNLQTDSAESIRAKWLRWSTESAFELNPMLGRVWIAPKRPGP